MAPWRQSATPSTGIAARKVTGNSSRTLIPVEGSDYTEPADLKRIVQILRNWPREARIVVVTDGEDHEGGVEDVGAALSAASVSTIFVGVGGRLGEPIPVVDEKGAVQGYQKDRTGKVTAATLDSGENVAGRFQLKTAIGELGVPLSPDSLVLPKEAVRPIVTG